MIAVAHDQHPQRVAHAEHDEAVFIVRMVRIKVSNGILIEEHRLRLLKGDTVSPLVLAALFLVPFETDASHMYTVHMEIEGVNCSVAELVNRPVSIIR